MRLSIKRIKKGSEQEIQIPKIEGTIGFGVDVDGLLLMTEDIYRLATSDVSEDMFGHAVSKEEWGERWVGNTSEYIAHELSKMYGSENDVKIFLEHREDRLSKRLKRGHIEAMPDAETFLTNLLKHADRYGGRVCFSTGGTYAHTLYKIEHAWLGIFLNEIPIVGKDHKFTEEAISEHGNLEGKIPIFLASAKELMAPMGNFFVYEDSEAGIDSAREAGVRFTIAVPNEYTKNREFKNAYAIEKNLMHANYRTNIILREAFR